MGHTAHDKGKLLSRVRRIRGQVEALERAVDGEEDCFAVLQLIAACRGAISGLMSEVIEGHIRHHVLDPAARPNAKQNEAAEELIGVLKTYLK
jgi:DNA-binding FrmR family transcriptional regulator